MDKRTESEGIAAEMEGNTLPGAPRKSVFSSSVYLRAESVLFEKNKTKRKTSRVLCHLGAFVTL